MAGDGGRLGLIGRAIEVISDVERSGVSDAAYARRHQMARSAISEARRLVQLTPLCHALVTLSRGDARDLLAELGAIAAAAGMTVTQLAEQIAPAVSPSASVDDVIRLASAHGHPAGDSPELTAALVDACLAVDVQLHYQPNSCPIPSLPSTRSPSAVIAWATICLARYLPRIRRVELDQLAVAAMGPHSRRHDNLHDLVGAVARFHGVSPVAARHALQVTLCSRKTPSAARAALMRLICAAAGVEDRAI